MLALAAALLPISLAAVQVRAPADGDGSAPTVRIPSAASGIDAVLQRPAAAAAAAPAKSPAVIVVHDDQGVNDAMRGIARQLASEGFVAVVPNLASRAAAAADRGRGEPAAATAAPGRGRGSAVAGLPLSQTVDDVKAAFAFLLKDSAVDAARISVIGFGWGGWRALKLAEQTPSLYRAVVYYSTTPDPSAAAIRRPVLGHYAEYDFQTTGNVLATRQRLGETYTFFIYPDTDRGFAGGGSGAMDFSAAAAESLSAGAATGALRSPQGIAQAAAKQAWDRTLTFLRGGTPR
jgi:carboxymethylenebutenolidase